MCGDCIWRGDEITFKHPPVEHQDRPWGPDVTCDRRKEVKLVIEPADIICVHLWIADRLLQTSFHVMTSLIHHMSLIIGEK